MVFKNNFVVAVKNQGKVLREQNGKVALPFGSEYAISLKNLNSVRAQVKVSIDGECVTDGWLVLSPYQSIDLERFIKNGNLESGNRFRFIERTQDIEDYRGVKAEDGIVVVEYKFEKVYPSHNYIVYNDFPVQDWERCPKFPAPKYFLGSISGQSCSETSCYSGNLMRLAVDYTANLNDAGITVPGSESNQKFHRVSGFDTEASKVISLQLVGQVEGYTVTNPITVDKKKKCKYCGKVNKHYNKFCHNCGAALNTI